MKHITLLLPLIAALTGMSYAVAEDKPVPGPGMTSAATPQVMKDMDMKAKGDMMKPEGDMKTMHDKCMEVGKGMDDMKAMHDKCMQGMKDMSGMKAAAPAKKTTHRKTVKKSAAPAAEHDHNHGATPTP